VKQQGLRRVSFGHCEEGNEEALSCFDSGLPRRLRFGRLLAMIIEFPYNHPMTSEGFQIGDRVRVSLDSNYWRSAGWFDGTIIRIDPYSEHRNFYWVELDVEVQPLQGGKTAIISVLNPRNIVRL
jgi:hypothetical protein